jgi:acetolactate synthase-1/2/3 large subunit
VLFANRGYRILQLELARAGEQGLGPAAASLLELGNPEIDWVRLAEGFGVPARRVTTAEELVSAMHWALAESGPHLLEAVL